LVRRSNLLIQFHPSVFQPRADPDENAGNRDGVAKRRGFFTTSLNGSAFFAHLHVAFAAADAAVKVSLTKPIYRFETEDHDVPSPQGQQ
jgi:hypothetical protein